jgi:drug/metabolite transporter (DMT)-like permease
MLGFGGPETTFGYASSSIIALARANHWKPFQLLHLWNIILIQRIYGINSHARASLRPDPFETWVQRIMTSLLLGLIAALCWGLHDITVRYLSQTVSLLAALFTVLSVGALFQFGVLTITGGGLSLQPTGFALAIGAGVCFLIASLGLYYAFERGPVRLVSPIIASYPVLSITFEIASGATVTALQATAVLAVVVGIASVAALSRDSGGRVPPRGPTIALSILSACGFAGTFKLGQLAAEHSDEISSTFLTRVVALALLGLLIWLTKSRFWPGWAALVPLTIMGILDGIALLSVISAAPLPHPEHAAVASSVFGLLTIVLAWAFLKERMTVSQWLGCILTFLGIGYLAL